MAMNIEDSGLLASAVQWDAEHVSRRVTKPMMVAASVVGVVLVGISPQAYKLYNRVLEVAPDEVGGRLLDQLWVKEEGEFTWAFTADFETDLDEEVAHCDNADDLREQCIKACPDRTGKCFYHKCWTGAVLTPWWKCVVSPEWVPKGKWEFATELEEDVKGCLHADDLREECNNVCPNHERACYDSKCWGGLLLNCDMPPREHREPWFESYAKKCVKSEEVLNEFHKCNSDCLDMICSAMHCDPLVTGCVKNPNEIDDLGYPRA